MSNYILKIHKDGEIKYCSAIIGFPVTLEFIGSFDHEQPYRFASEFEAWEYWRLYQQYRPADATDWTAKVVKL